MFENIDDSENAERYRHIFLQLLVKGIPYYYYHLMSWKLAEEVQSNYKQSKFNKDKKWETDGLEKIDKCVNLTLNYWKNIKRHHDRYKNTVVQNDDCDDWNDLNDEYSRFVELIDPMVDNIWISKNYYERFPK